MARFIEMLSFWRRARARRSQAETQARAATVYVARDGRGHVISSH